MKSSKLSLIILGIAAILYLFSVWHFAPSLPEKVATHFNATGNPDGWMSRSQYTIFVSIFGVGASGFIIGICYSIRFFPSSTLNVPNSDYWRKPENYSLACDIILRFSIWLGVAEIVFMGFLNYLVLQANLVRPPGLSSEKAWILTSIFVCLVLVWALSLTNHFRKTKNVEQGAAPN
jgi:uncharacterized membrane protein